MSEKNHKSWHSTCHLYSPRWDNSNRNLQGGLIMLQHQILFACILHILNGYPNACPNNAYAHEVANAIDFYSNLESVHHDIVVSTAYDESRFKKNAVSNRGAIGILQIKRNGSIQGEDLKLSDRKLMEIDTNVRIGVHYLAQFAHKCNIASEYLTNYNQGPDKHICRSSAYGRHIVKDLNLGRKWEKQLFPPMVYAGEFIIESKARKGTMIQSVDP